MNIGETIDHALKIRDEIKKETGKDLELSFSTNSIPPLCETITISAYYKPEGEEKWWVMKRAFDRSVLEVDGKGLINHFFLGLKKQMSFTDKHRPAPQLACENCKYFDMNETFPCMMWRTIVGHGTPACHNFKPKEQ